ncbi:ATP-binding cassette domain-containing protein [Plebeiibacterium sediminum]|uniref:ATP-binding cassette domain-containing protein n=1 Tax=Plebeiibacterium sediminum TaxID=2992112 RepID=A0AAE3M0Y0_9BACT|nr:ATP-binding cassette domain-containing protein [Plebeiobacterium sediminum]MCW3785189.1 ATP-binding cassette domain-containing protein [Plebeiobacterium sediminum]
METEILLHKPLKEIVNENPLFSDFFSSFQIKAENEHKSFTEYISTQPDSFWDENASSKEEIANLFVDYISGIAASEQKTTIETLDILRGIDKSKNPENCNLHLNPGEITCIVGPTGSGKSRLLADIEWLANGDTPTKRKVLINGQPADEDTSALFGGKLIAQITQNMNFVLDMDVESFLMLHAQSRLLMNAEDAVKEVMKLANELSGEPFDPTTPVTFLSGGQSRALMIADVACIGQAPIVLIDEIENAGVNKKKALDLLVSKDKIVLMATHDPLLILLADKRVVIKNGGMDKIITTNTHEKGYYAELEKMDKAMQEAKDFFRYGNELKES